MINYDWTVNRLGLSTEGTGASIPFAFQAATLTRTIHGTRPAGTACGCVENGDQSRFLLPARLAAHILGVCGASSLRRRLIELEMLWAYTMQVT